MTPERPLALKADHEAARRLADLVNHEPPMHAPQFINLAKAYLESRAGADREAELKKRLDLSWAVGKYGDGTWDAAIAEAESNAIRLLCEDDSSEQWASDYIRRAARSPHAGDCSIAPVWHRAPITCDACVYEEYMLKAWARMRAALSPQEQDDGR
jgi:hypothetical protein